MNGVASPRLAQMDDKLSCFDDQTSRSINQYVKEQWQSRYPASDPNRTAISNPHDEFINLTVDGMCIFALTMENVVPRAEDD